MFMYLRVDHRVPAMCLNLAAGVSDGLCNETCARVNVERWPLKSGQAVKLFPSMRRTGLYGQGHAQAIHG
jgi:hypothetical protein